jgi:hypothetical protein
MTPVRGLSKQIHRFQSAPIKTESAFKAPLSKFTLKLGSQSALIKTNPKVLLSKRNVVSKCFYQNVIRLSKSTFKIPIPVAIPVGPVRDHTNVQ